METFLSLATYDKASKKQQGMKKDSQLGRKHSP